MISVLSLDLDAEMTYSSIRIRFLFSRILALSTYISFQELFGEKGWMLKYYAVHFREYGQINYTHGIGDGGPVFAGIEYSYMLNGGPIGRRSYHHLLSAYPS